MPAMLPDVAPRSCADPDPDPDPAAPAASRTAPCDDFAVRAGEPRLLSRGSCTTALCSWLLRAPPALPRCESDPLPPPPPLFALPPPLAALAPAPPPRRLPLLPGRRADAGRATAPLPPTSEAPRRAGCALAWCPSTAKFAKLPAPASARAGMPCTRRGRGRACAPWPDPRRAGPPLEGIPPPAPRLPWLEPRLTAVPRTGAAARAVRLSSNADWNAVMARGSLPCFDRSPATIRASSSSSRGTTPHRPRRHQRHNAAR